MIPPSQRVEMIAPTLLKAILKFCTTNKLFKLDLLACDVAATFSRFFAMVQNAIACRTSTNL